METSSRAWELIVKELDGGLDPQEQLELRQLLDADPQLALQRQMLLATRPVISGMPEVPGVRKEQLLNNILNQGNDAVPLSSPLPRSRRMMRIMAAAAVLAGIGLGIWFLLAQRPETGIPWHEVKVQAGRRLKVTLPDGSVIVLNSNSRLQYPARFTQGLREVRLSGEAYFNVTANANTPFVIHTAEVDVKVLGTVFNLRAYPEDRVTETSLISGAVEVTMLRHGGKKVMLRPMQKVLVPKDAVVAAQAPATTVRTIRKPAISLEKVMVVSGENQPEETAWLEDRLVFRDERFDELALRIARKHGIRIVFQKEAAKQLVFSGTFQGENIEEMLKIMQQVHQFEYTISSQTIVIN